MRIIGFLVFLSGVVLGLWWLGLIGLVLYEATGITWIAASTSGGHGIHHDHGP